jgi:hypothetical protein
MVSQCVFDRATNVPFGSTGPGPCGSSAATGTAGEGATLGGAATTGGVAEARVQETPASRPTRAYVMKRRELTR